MSEKNSAAVMLGKRRMAKMTKAQRTALARKAARTYWDSQKAHKNEPEHVRD